MVHFYSGNVTYGAVGGIVGRAIGCQIYNCTNYCDINTQHYGGGIVGYAGSTEIKNCRNNGALSGNNKNNNSRSSLSIGGILGGSVYNDSVSIQICSNYGKITAKGNSAELIAIHAGGICASSSTKDRFEYCYNVGSLEMIKGGPTFTGQICGIAPHACKNCYNVGTINAEGAHYILGVGRRNAGVVNSYYLNTCMPNGVDVAQGGIERTEAQMKSVSFPAMLNTDSVVYVMDEQMVNDGYPIFGSGQNGGPVSVHGIPPSHYKVCTLEGKKVVVHNANYLPMLITNAAGQIVYKTDRYSGDIINLTKSGIYIICVGTKCISKIYIN